MVERSKPIVKKYPWEHDGEEKPRQSCQVATPRWYENNTMFKPIKDWTDKELADEHEICRAKMSLEESRGM